MVDNFGRQITYLRLSVTDRCNLRCRYCMPEEGICKKAHTDILTEEEMIQAVEVAAELGVCKLRLTGGEPLVKKNILSLCERSSRVPGIREVCLTTNGLLLPQFAKPLYDAGVKRLNISLDTLDPEKYSYITRNGKLSDVLEGIETALKVGFQKIKINTVLIGGFNDDEIRALTQLTQRWPVDVRFIEMMPMVEHEIFGKDAYVSYKAVLDQIPDAVEQKEDGGVARRYRFPGALGCVGLISPVNAHFCGSCNRLRLTADGKIKPCLHSSVEYSIKGLGRADVLAQFKRAILEKPACHGTLSAEQRSGAGRNMNEIGG